MLRLLLSAFCISCSISVKADLPFNPSIQDGQHSYTVSTTRDGVNYHEPAYKKIGDRVYEVSQNTGNIQYHKPSYKIEGNRVYEVSPSTGIVQYHKPSYMVK
jgi:hypothetical protein